MPVVAGEKTAGERFPGAQRTFTVEGMMRDGRALQSGTSHYLGTNFARAFGIQYTAESGELEYCHTTSWGMSSRMVGGVIMTHGDDKGLVLPPLLAPYQVVIVPIGRGDQAGLVLPPAMELAERLRRAGVRAHVDEADAMRETMLALGLYADVAREIAAMPVVAGEKTAGERFPGARQTFTVEGMMRDGRALQAGTSHYLGTNFARAFGIQYTAESGELEYCHGGEDRLGAGVPLRLARVRGRDQGRDLGDPAVHPLSRPARGGLVRSV